ncbi:MAG: OsmC family protein [Acidimicrobiia bacterium]|nr:OsmC family protein [Acidimicrobiia bacterium]
MSAGDFDLQIDEPESVAGGTNQGPQPTDLLLASISSCFTLALAHTARKRSLNVQEIRVDVTGHYDGPSFRRIDINAFVDCEPAELPQLLAGAERVCYVTNTLRGGVELVVAGSSRTDVSDS